MRGSDRLFVITQPLSMSLPTQCHIEQMRESDGRLLQLAADDRGVRRDIGRVDHHFKGESSVSCSSFKWIAL